MEAAMNIPVIVISIVFFAICIVADKTLKLPLGITCLIGALVIGYLGLGIAPNKAITQFFPAFIVSSMMFAMTFFLVFSSNGTMDIIAKYVLRMIRGRTKLFPWIMYVASILLYTLTGGEGIMYAIVPMTFAIAKKIGISYQMAATTMVMSLLCGSMNPFIGTFSANRMSYMLQNGITNASGVAVGIWVGTLAVCTIVQFIMYILTRSWKVPDVEFDIDKAREQVKLNATQMKSFWVLGISILLLVFPPVANMILKTAFTEALVNVFSNFVVFLLGILAILLLKIDDWRGMAKRINAALVIMIIGITYLVHVVQAAGIQIVLQDIARSVPKEAIPPILVISFGVLSFFVSGMALSPIMYPFAISLAQTQAQGIIYLTCILLGTAITGCSPISGQGAQILSILPGEDQNELSRILFRQAFLNILFVSLIVAAGMLTIFGNIFAEQFY